MKFVWIMFIIIAVEQIITLKLVKDKKQLIIYCFIVILSVILCVKYDLSEYESSMLGFVNSKVNLERYVWISQTTK